MSRAIIDAASLLLLPPAAPLLLLVSAAFLLRAKRRRLAAGAAATAFALLWLCSLGVVGDALLRALEPPPATDAGLAGAAAIVVLGADRIHASPEYGEDIVNQEGLGRLRYAARLARRTGLPILVAGGKPYGGVLSEGEAMARVLDRDFGLPARWIEARSTTTAENAAQAFTMLDPEGRRRIALVTTAWHMPRAARAFRRAGFEVIQAPTGYVSREPARPMDWLPSAQGLYRTHVALREWLGRAWYRLRGVG